MGETEISQWERSVLSLGSQVLFAYSARCRIQSKVKNKYNYTFIRGFRKFVELNKFLSKFCEPVSGIDESAYVLRLP